MTPIEANKELLRQNKALSMAAANGDLAAIKLAINNTATEDDKFAAIKAVAINGEIECAKFLIQHGADPCADKSFPLYLAATWNNYDICKLFLEHGADPRNRDSAPLSDAANNGYANICELLIEHGADPKHNHSHALRVAVTNGRTETCKLLLNRGANAAALDNEAINDALKREHKTIFKMLIEHGATPKNMTDSLIYGYFGEPKQAVEDIHQGYSSAVIEVLLKWFIKSSNKNITDLLNSAEDWLKPYYLSIMSEGM